jgi:hypothetical protein
MRGRWMTMGLLVLGSLGCSGIFVGDEPLVAPDEEEKRDTGEDDGTAEGDTALDTALDTGQPKPRPRKGKKGEKKKKKPGDGKGSKGGKNKSPGGDKGGGGKGGKTKASSFCFSAPSPKLSLRFDVDGSSVVGGNLSVKDAKANVSVPSLKGTKEKGRLVASGKGTVNGKDKTVQVQAGQKDGKAIVQVDGHTIKGAVKTPCK